MKWCDGFYWTKLNGTWRVARFSTETQQWYLAGIECGFDGPEFEEINEQRILPPNQ